MSKSVFLGSSDNINRVYGESVRKKLINEAGLVDVIYSKEDILSSGGCFSDTEYIFSTWGMPSFDEKEIQQVFPSLKAVFYAAGSVLGFAEPFLRSGVAVFSAWAANAIPVSEYTLAQIILANKGFFAASALYGKTRSKKKAAAISKAYPGNYGINIGLLGCGMVGSLVAERLKMLNVTVKVFDPFLPDEKARALNVSKTSLEDIFSSCNVVSNHLANKPETTGIIGYNHFISMTNYAVFINTGRGAQVREDEMCRALSERPDIYALLDVTYPEPPVPDSTLYNHENIILTPHIAGSSGNEVHRMAEYMLDEFRAFSAHLPVKYSVTLDMLKTMA